MVIDIFISGLYVYTYCSYLAETYSYDLVKLRADWAAGFARQGEAGSKMLFYQGVAIVIQLFGEKQGFLSCRYAFCWESAMHMHITIFSSDTQYISLCVKLQSTSETKAIG